jgi:pre-60S factor REI1
MLGKGHCKFDIAGDDSEFADFYDLSGSEAESDEDDEDADGTPTTRKSRTNSPAVQIDEHSLRLPSGKVISNRSQPQNSTRRQLLKLRAAGKPDQLEDAAVDVEDAAEPATSSSSTSLITRSGGDGLAKTRAEKQEIRFSKQLASLRASDEQSLAHLTQPQQRALLATQQKQVEKAARVEERYRGRLEGLGNKFLMTHFVKDAADKRTLWK